jgi:hypothetical protein
MNSNVFAKYACDDLDRVVDAATKENASDQIRVLNQLSQKGNDFWRLWAEAAGGGLLEEGFGCGTVEFPASKLGEVTRQADQYTYLLGMTISVGVGKSLDEIEQAFKLAKKRGGNQLVLFTEDTLQELAGKEADDKIPLFDENDKIPADGLAKSYSRDGTVAPTKQNFDSSEEGVAGTIASYQNPEQEHTRTVQDFQAMRNKLRGHAQQQEHLESISRVKNSEDLSQLKNKVATVLQGVKEQLPALAGLKTTNPDAYQAVLALVQSVISLGKQLSDTDKQLTKAEEMYKGMGEMPNYPGFGTESIGLSKKDVLPGGRADDMSPVDFDPEHLDEGTQHELEHTTDKDMAREIAMDHLAEDPEYYKKLKEIEKGSDKETARGKVHFKYGKVHIRRHLNLPVGTILNGKMKIRHYNGSVGWVSIRGGMARSNTDPTGHAVSARKPNAK